MGKIIACVNEKGGVGKTTSTKNIAVGLHNKGFKVLAIDLDPSANLTKSLDISVGEQELGTIGEIIENAIDLGADPLPADYGIVHTDEGVDLMTSSPNLRSTEAKLLTTMQREIVLRRYMQQISDNYDYIFMDCPAGLGIFVDNALFAADSVIIPTKANYLDIEAMQNLFSKIAMVRKLNGTGRKPDILGVVFTSVRQGTNNNKFFMNELRESYKGKVNIFNSYICLNSKIPESDAARESIFKYAPNGPAAINYSDLVEEIISMDSDSK